MDDTLIKSKAKDDADIYLHNEVMVQTVISEEKTKVLFSAVISRPLTDSEYFETLAIIQDKLKGFI